MAECIECGIEVTKKDDLTEVSIAEGISTIKVYEPHGLIHTKCVPAWKEKNVC